MITSAPTDCACRESRMASAVLVGAGLRDHRHAAGGLVDDGLDDQAALVDGQRA